MTRESKFPGWKFAREHSMRFFSCASLVISVVACPSRMGSGFTISAACPPPECLHDSPFLLCEHRRAFVLGDFGVVVDPDDQLVAEGFRLPEGVGVPEVHHVVAEMRTENFSLINRL